MKWEFTWVFSTSLSLFPKLSALIGGPLVKYVYNDNAIFALVTSGVSFDCCNFSSKSKNVDDVIKQQ
jgi:maltose/moltooligosaccharide transporter